MNNFNKNETKIGYQSNINWPTIIFTNLLVTFWSYYYTKSLKLFFVCLLYKSLRE